LGVFRQWTDSTGQFKVQAKFLRVEGEAIVLEKKDGEKIAVPKGRMSQADLKLIAATSNLKNEGGKP
jgi:hypothetical protein